MNKKRIHFFIDDRLYECDLKYDLMRHPNIKRTPDFNPKLRFAHGDAPLAAAGLVPAGEKSAAAWKTASAVAGGSYEALTETEIETEIEQTTNTTKTNDKEENHHEQTG